MKRMSDKLPLLDNPIQDRLLSMQAILCLVENSLGVRFESFFINFLATISGQTMHYERIRFGKLHQRGIDFNPDWVFGVCVIA